MASSTNLWHYTNYEALRNILKDGCLKPSDKTSERYDFLNCKKKKFQKICLTNISIEDSKMHRVKYGDYCIGFKNKWVKENRISPIIYCRKEAKLTELIEKILTKIDKEDKELFLKYCKPYSDCNSKCKDENKRELLRRYDEHEWRYIPESDTDVLKFTPQDVSKIYVPKSKEEDLKKQIPDYKEKITGCF